MAIENQFGNWTSKVRFVADIESHVSGELTTKAMARFDLPIEGEQQDAHSRENPDDSRAGGQQGRGLRPRSQICRALDELSAGDKLQLDRLINDWQGVREIRPARRAYPMASASHRATATCSLITLVRCRRRAPARRPHISPRHCRLTRATSRSTVADPTSRLQKTRPRQAARPTAASKSCSAEYVQVSRHSSKSRRSPVAPKSRRRRARCRGWRSSVHRSTISTRMPACRRRKSSRRWRR